MAKKYGARKPSKTVQIEILDMQDCRCAYCNIGLDQVQIEWDHFIPRSWSLTRQSDNFVAACRPCNQAKQARLFASEADLTQFCVKMIKLHGSRGIGAPEGISGRFLAI